MLTKEQVLKSVKNKTRQREACEFIDSRDYNRLVDFFPVEQWEAFGLKLREGMEAPQMLEWNEETVKEKMARDLAFSFDKALNKRGISSNLMYEVMKMWMWVLEDPLAEHTEYRMYGLPLYKAIAIKYDLPNPIGDDEGNEQEYNEVL